MMKKAYLLLCCLLFVVQIPAPSQQICDDDIEIRNFLRTAEGFPENIDLGSLYGIELLKHEATLNTKWGIFAIGICVDHVHTHFLLIKNGVRQYIDTYTDTIKILQTIFEFLDATQFTDSEKLSYIRFVINICDSNSTVNPWEE